MDIDLFLYKLGLVKVLLAIVILNIPMMIMSSIRKEIDRRKIEELLQLLETDK